ncbi:MAG: DNA modification methylase [Patescibacteria group bacterium]|jgi:hypothetical protein
MKKQLLKWRTVKRRVDDLAPYDRNPRQISDKQLEDLKKSLKTMGLVEIPAIDLDGRIVAGHQRIRVLKLLGKGQDFIDVRLPNRKLTQKEFEQYLLSSNALGGDWNYEKLKSFEIDTLLSIGFDETQLTQIWDGVLETEDDNFQVEKELEQIKKPKTKLGDVFALGAHKIAVGDARDPGVYKRLFSKERASMVYADPIYNIGLDYDKGLGGKQQYGGTVNDRQSDEAYRDLLKRSMENALSVAMDDAHVFYWCDESYIWLIQSLYRELSITNRRVCMWIKGPHNPTPNVAFNKACEPVVYGTRGKPCLTKSIQNLNEVFNKELSSGNRLIDDVLDLLNIWLVKRLSGDQYEHATSKPPSLHEKAIRRCTRPGDIILDSFLGSGSTLIAGEQLKRRVYGVELEPIYCDLIIKRYERLTHIKAKKLN